MYQCDYCTKSFTRLENLQRHKDNVHGIDYATMYHCDYCSKMFKRLDNLKRHKNNVHSTKSSKSMSDFIPEEVIFKKRDSIRNKDTFALSEKKFVYSLGEEDLIIRSTGNANINALVHSTGNPTFNAFGISGRENITRIFYSILTLLDHHHVVFLSSPLCDPTKFGTLLGSTSERDRIEMGKLAESAKDGQMRMIMINEYTRIHLTPGYIPHPQIGLIKMTENVNGELVVQTGIYLYPNELMNLIIHLKSTHSISPTVPGDPG